MRCVPELWPAASIAGSSSGAGAPAKIWFDMVFFFVVVSGVEVSRASAAIGKRTRSPSPGSKTNEDHEASDQNRAVRNGP